MLKISVLGVVFAGVMSTAATSQESCSPPPAASSSGLARATISVQPGSDGLSVEQRNVRDRLVADNKPGSIKHLYVISAYSGQVLIYSTVRGKVTSSGKRLTPEHIEGLYNSDSNSFGVPIGQYTAYTREVLGDDGTYGNGVPYIYWFDAKGAYHQHYVEGGQIIHISDQPLAVKSVVLNMELEK
jgi:hypothetical protein